MFSLKAVTLKALYLFFIPLLRKIWILNLLFTFRNICVFKNLNNIIIIFLEECFFKPKYLVVVVVVVVSVNNNAL